MIRNEDNRRLRERVPFSVVVRWEVMDRETEYNICRDISMNGIYLMTDRIFPIGTKGLLTIRMDAGEQHLELRINCTVARIVGDKLGREQQGMALTFDYISPDDSLELFNIIRYQAGHEPW